MKTITRHYIDGAFVESHGQEVIEIVRPTDRQVIGRLTLGDEEDTRRAIAAAKRAFASFRRTTKEERIELLRNLHKAVFARIDDLTNAMVEEYGGARTFSNQIVAAGAAVFLSASKALEELPLSRSWGTTTVILEPVGVTGVITP
jgi:aldehyde dehydrogenase (NAD+)